MDEQKEKNAQMTFDFGFTDDSVQEVEVMDIGDAEDSQGLPPDDLMPEGESLSLSEPEEEMEEEFPVEAEEKESAYEEGEEGIEIISDDEPFVSSGVEKENESVAERGQDEDIPAAESVAEPVPVKREKVLAFDAKNVRRSALAFLASLGADAVAADVPLRYRKYVVDAAACWCSPDSKKGMKASRTAAVQVVMKDSAFFTEKGKLLPLLAEAKEELENLKKEIRTNEPSLRICDTLFCDEVRWDYSRSADPRYKALLDKIAGLEKTLFRGTVFDRLRKTRSASEFYLVVPEDFIAKESVPEEWGLVYVKKDLSFHLVKEPGTLVSSPEDMNFLALNIARASMQNVLFANGILKRGDNWTLIRQPRKRRA